MFILYLKPGCPYCEQSKKIIEDNNFKHEFITEPDYEKREKLKKKHNMPTFPQIFYRNKKKSFKIGGNDDLINKLKHCNILGKLLNKSLKMDSINTDLLIIKHLYKEQKVSKKVINKLNKLIK
tara:strand:+ start:553 stop:921 length:369 start_codon:yes stop_codon:yes gene_type:complete